MIALAFDTETSGIPNSYLTPLDRQPEIIEFCGLLCTFTNKGFVVNDEINTLIKPATPLSDRKVKGNKTISDITGITNEMLQTAPPFKEVAQSIIGMIEHAPMVIAHNLSFDKEMVDIEAKRLNKLVKWPMGLCTVEATVHLRGGRMTLTQLHEFLYDGAKFDAHRAKEDVAALCRCIAALKKRKVI